jgi:hypothetical protein
MSQVIVYANNNGSVSVTIPTGEIAINEVLAKDCPSNAIIIDFSDLPQGDDANYFDAWELVGNQVVVNQIKKQAIIDAIQAPILAKESALNKLTALGLTQAEVTALVG